MSPIGLFISAETTQRGDLTLNQSVYIDGHFEGSIDTTGDVTISPGGSFTGTLRCQQLTLHGQFNGNAEIRNTALLKKNSVFHGTLDTPRAEIAIGCQLVGEAHISAAPQLISAPTN